MNCRLRYHGFLSGVACAVAAAAALIAQPAAAQLPSWACQSVNPPQEICPLTGPCMFRYRQCQLDFNDDNVNERVAYFFEDRGTEESELFAVGDRRCYQGNNFDPLAAAPDIVDDEYGFNRFILVFPDDFNPVQDSGPLPLYIDMRQGTAGWVQAAGVGSNSWALDFTGDINDPEWKKGIFHGIAELAQPAFSEQNMIGRMLDPEGFEADLRATGDPSYAFLIPSGCSFDCHNGRPGLDDPLEPLLREVARTRFSYVAIFEALEFIRQQYDGIDHIYAGAQSGGGKGAFILARDLPVSDSFYAGEGIFRGVIMASAPAEWDALATLFDASDTIRVDTDGICEARVNEEAEVPSDHGSEPLVTAFVETATTGYSASLSILLEQVEDVPILHVWNRRDPAHAYDACYSEANIHGPIRQRINGRTDEPFAFSENMEVCIGSCLSLNDVAVHCVEHGLMEEPVVIACALDWIAEINEFCELEDEYVTPASCVDPDDDIDESPVNECRDQSEMM